MRKGVVVLLACAVACSAWARGSTEPKPAPAPPPAPTIRITMPQVYTRSASMGWSHAEIIMTVPVSSWTDGHREFAGAPSFQVFFHPVFPYQREVPAYATTKVTNTKFLIVASYVRAFERLVVPHPTTGIDIYISFPMIQVQPYTFTFTP